MTAPKIEAQIFFPNPLSSSETGVGKVIDVLAPHINPFASASELQSAKDQWPLHLILQTKSDSLTYNAGSTNEVVTLGRINAETIECTATFSTAEGFTSIFECRFTATNHLDSPSILIISRKVADKIVDKIDELTIIGNGQDGIRYDSLTAFRSERGVLEHMSPLSKNLTSSSELPAWAISFAKVLQEIILRDPEIYLPGRPVQAQAATLSKSLHAAFRGKTAAAIALTAYDPGAAALAPN